MAKATICLGVLIAGASLGCRTVEPTLSAARRQAIHQAIQSLFQANLAAGEARDLARLQASVDDTYQAGFMTNGRWYSTFADCLDNVRTGFDRIQRLQYQVAEQRITVLSPTTALLTARGTFSATDAQDATFDGDFLWTFVYAKIDDAWKVVHSHQSSGR
ncbi:MAG: nuclear transport factor 2 family protein [Sedimentisphaerales bacterium]|nr:nuclear transport factor 2 family protein [Sedimentisphaerales bacterium]